MTEAYNALRHGVSLARSRLAGAHRCAWTRPRPAAARHFDNEVKKMYRGQLLCVSSESAGGVSRRISNCSVSIVFLSIPIPACVKVLQQVRRYIIADQVELEDVSSQLASIGVEVTGAGELEARFRRPYDGSVYHHRAAGISRLLRAGREGRTHRRTGIVGRQSGVGGRCPPGPD